MTDLKTELAPRMVSRADKDNLPADHPMRTLALAIERTSPKGGPFIGTCFQCGQTGLKLSAVFDDCPNVRGLTQDETLIEAITPRNSQEK